ncbi:hypothetical protein ACFO3J_20660 [Streptomyces polygonati]|uniref:Sugar phosphate isomerase/epimerase n=1 Tax=Streptomyces polygonati TaxID=1617087 RepID=A0ABV8HPC0_9ACTN
MSFALVHFAPPMADAKPHSAIGKNSYTFICPLCFRTPQVKADRWWTMLEAVAAAGLDQLDISLLPL